MLTTTTDVLIRFEALVKSGEMVGFSVSIKKNGLLIRSKDGAQEQTIGLDSETLSSLEVFFYGVVAIQNDSFDYANLKCLLNAKSILDRMLHSSDPERA